MNHHPACVLCVCLQGCIKIICQVSCVIPFHLTCWKTYKEGLKKSADKVNEVIILACLFLAHLSTTCSRGAFRVVMCPSCVVNNFFEHLLLPNRRANLDQTWQECSLGGPLQNLFTEFDSIKISGCHGNEIEFFKQFFKNLLLWNRRSNFEIISQECSLGDPFQKLFAKFWWAQKHGSGEWVLLAL